MVYSRPPAAVLPVGVKAIRSQATGKCIDVPANRADATGAMALWDCNGVDGQKYLFPADGTLRVFGRCLQVDGSADGSTLHLADCTGSRMQQFTFDTSADLMSRPLDKCVEAINTDQPDGALIRIARCGGSSYQKWSLV